MAGWLLPPRHRLAGGGGGAGRLAQLVMRGPDPRIHQSSREPLVRRMDRRVKPGDDDVEIVRWAKRKRAHHFLRGAVVGTALARLCPPYDITANPRLPPGLSCRARGRP